jgi:serine/threonine protein kinase/formylglycine-generating enzyme required for sulfatase activity
MDSSFLICPVCGDRFPADPGRPYALYECPKDRVKLVKQSADATVVLPRPRADATTVIVGGSAPAATSTVNEERRSVLSLFHPSDSGETAPAATAKEKYEVVGELGKGGMAQVLKVLDRDLKREVAMKMLLPEDGGSAAGQTRDALLRFIEEAQATGQLEHPNIVPVHDLGVDATGRVYFTLKYVQGHSLKHAIRGRDENAVSPDGMRFRDIYSPQRVLEILISICQAVAYAHSKGIIHRDLKPDNVMLGKYGEVLVMDWGLAKVVGIKDSSAATSQETVRIVSTTRAAGMSEATMEGSVAGTPAYMSPEQAAGKISAIDQRTDIYALGAILYEVLSGVPPYRGANALQTVQQVLNGPPAAIKSQKGGHGFAPIPRELAGICERAMARQPEDRYPTATALRDDLQAYVENRPVSAAPDTSLQKLAKWVKRNRRQVQSGTLSAATVLLLVLAAWFGWQQWRLHQFLTEGQNLLNAAREEYKFKTAAQAPNRDVYAAQINRSIWLQNASLFRAALQQAMDPVRKALDLSRNNWQARSLMAEANMDLWRLATYEENTELANVTRREVERFAPDPALYSTELNGFGALIAGFDAPDAEAFLFRFETLTLPAKDGVTPPPRWIPVPYDAKYRAADLKFLEQERARAIAGKPLPADKHSIFNLEPTAASRVGSAGRVIIPELPPGNYMLLVRAPGRIEVRVSFRMERLARVKQDYLLPKVEDNPPGFFYMAGGDIMVGGETAGAAAPHTMKVGPAWIFHDEISMADYAAFLLWLTQNGRTDEARRRLPRDFGKNLAALGGDGRLAPADAGIDAAAFAKSPVRGVSYSDARAYVAWRSQQDGLQYRLPKDYEWEAACRGADGRKYSWGETPGQGLAVVTQGYGDTGGNMSWKWEDYKDESPWGIHNLAGAAAEWTESLYDPNAKAQDPVYGQLTIRGNAWALPPVGLECAFRTSGQPDYFHPTIGFRIALDHPYTRTAPGGGRD